MSVHGCRCIYYYTPLPLNLATKQQASSKQASIPVLAITSPHCSGLYSTLGTLEPRSCPCQIQVWSQKVIGGGTGLGGALTKKSILCPETAFFGPKGPRNQVKTNKQRETVRTLHVRLDCLVTNCPQFPSNSKIFPRNGPKLANDGPNCAHFVSTNPKTEK